ncbi:sugar ABC transporter ATP-binding protein [Leeia sp. TBRC 13508]|uniref:Sugar ABC transporter ATP-binding protein n=1 Tax=Leeia speluncae TaxID=2884804 RepID=A0ABS8D552_9NEIS|nr:sugar ABC transporter ATP-binding protein [Leeia speluncae]MCB6183344.1 sugar ABC transporter ATP-binding protein [Leeia speluncae]
MMGNTIVADLLPQSLPDQAAAVRSRSDEPVLELRDISKRFGGVKALTNMQVKAFPGQVVALIGENGAGKSTLVKILTGIHKPDGGQLLLDGQAQRFSSPQAAMKAGITAVHQETVMFDELSVAENIYIGHHPMVGTPARVDWAKMETDAEALFERLEVRMNVRAKVKELSIAQRHFVEIARALSQHARIVIMDEPTAALSQREIQELYRIIDQLKAAGTAVIFISHKFDEIFRVADRYTVLRDGEFVAEGSIADISEQQLIAMMVGRTIAQVFPKEDVPLGDTVLSVNGFSHPTEFDDVSFQLRKGEILGFYGLVGAGRSEVMQAVFGLTKPSRGSIEINGKKVVIKSAEEAIRAGIAYVPEDRQHQGGLMSMSILHNVTLPLLEKMGFWLLGKKRKELSITRDYTHKLELKAAHFGQSISELSGGNQQKVILAKWLATKPSVIILDEPTKGIDIGSKAAVHRFMSELVAQGLSVILVSSELPEVMGMSDRIIVMHQGQVVKEFARSEATSEAIVAAASGVTHD